MRNGLLIVILVTILLGVAAGTPLFILGKQKAELSATITQQSDTIAKLQVATTGLEADKVALQETISQLEGINFELHSATTEFQNTISDLGTALEEYNNIIIELSANNAELQAAEVSLSSIIILLYSSSAVPRSEIVF